MTMSALRRARSGDVISLQRNDNNKSKHGFILLNEGS